ncbi:MAG: rhomboid family intramembrane serine protease [Salibacteraceae bacterium]
MSNFLVEDLKRIIKGDNPLTKVILVNVVVFLVFNLLEPLFSFKSWFGLPGDLSELIWKPYTLVTYMFLHAGLFHLFFNMIWLYFVGQIILEYIGPKRFISIYFLGGIAGGLFYLVAYNLFILSGSDSIGGGLIGASAGVMAIVIAGATLVPDYRVKLVFFGTFPLKYIGVGIFILTSLLNLTENTGGKLAHVGGAIIGYTFIRMLQSGNDLSQLFYSFVTPLSNLFKKKKPKMRVVKNERKAKPTPKTAARPKAEQQRIDAILDKISASGYDALTAEEKEILFRASNKK